MVGFASGSTHPTPTPMLPNCAQSIRNPDLRGGGSWKCCSHAVRADAQGRRRRDHLTIQVQVERQTKLTVPIHSTRRRRFVRHGACDAGGHAIMRGTRRGGGVSHGIGAAHEQGRRSRQRQCSGAAYPVSLGDLDDKRAAVARGLVAGKVHNARNLILRAARETSDAADVGILQQAASRLADVLPALPRVPTLIAFAATKAMPPVSTSRRSVPHSAAA